MHIETINIHVSSGQDAMTRAFIEALLRGPESEPDATTVAPQQTGIKPPKIGEVWPGQGGICCGLARGEDGQPDYYLILAEAAPETDFSWQAGLDFAKTIEADGHKDFSVPTRFESALLYANVRDKLDTDHWHWTSTQYSEDDAYSQFFHYGYQYYYYKKYEGRCRFVRRLIL